MTEAKERRRRVASFYDAFADDYEASRYAAASQQQLASAADQAFLALAFAQPSPPRLVLDCGCGAGRLASLFAPVVETCVGFDVSDRMLGHARRKVPRALFVRGDVYGLSFRPMFDLVVSSQVLTHLHDYSGPLMAMRSVLSPQGSIVIDFRNLLNPRNLLYVVRHALRRRLRPASASTYDPHFTTLGNLRRVCRRLGLGVARCEGIGRNGARHPRDHRLRRAFAPTLAIRIDRLA